MWKRDSGTEPVRRETVTPATPSPPAPVPAVVSEPPPQRMRSTVPIGPSVVIKGELSGSEDLVVEGSIEGTVELRDNLLTIGPHGTLNARVFAKAVVVLGKVNGNITASEKVEIREGGSVEGDVVAPRVAIADGGHFRGSVDMQAKTAQLRQFPSQRLSDEPISLDQERVETESVLAAH